jgi:hypothetical protein
MSPIEKFFNEHHTKWQFWVAVSVFFTVVLNVIL